MKTNNILDCIIIGGGPSGLTAAIYLARFRRKFIIIDSGSSRASYIPITRNFPSYPKGISGKKLLARLKQQAINSGTEVINDTVLHIGKINKKIFKIETKDKTYQSYTVLLATGAIDIQPALANVEKSVLKGIVRHCPICDGFEVIGKKIGVIGNTDHTIREACFLHHYTNDITILTLGMNNEFSKSVRKKIIDLKLKVLTDPVQEIKCVDHMFHYKTVNKKQTYVFDYVYAALGEIVCSKLAIDLGAKCTTNHFLKVDSKQCTSVKGLYAAGDVVNGLSQISIACGQAAIASLAIHNYLLSKEYD